MHSQMISNLPLAITVSLHRLLEDVSWGSHLQEKGWEVRSQQSTKQIKEQGYERDGGRIIFDYGARGFVIKFVGLCSNRKRSRIDK